AGTCGVSLRQGRRYDRAVFRSANDGNAMKFGSTRGFLALLSAVASALCLGLAAPASGLGAVAALQDDRLALLPLDQLETRMDMLAATGAKVARVDLYWANVAPTRPANIDDPNDPAYQWARYDEIFTGLKA